MKRKRIKLKKIKLKLSDKINFTLKTDMYGRAEFDICPFWKDGKLKKILIYPRQQPDKEGIYYEIKCGDQGDLQISSWLHKGVDNPNIWRIYYCKEHKIIEYKVYAPDGTDTITFKSYSFVFEILFEKK